MACFSLVFLEQFLIWLAIIAGIIALIRLIVPAVVGPLGPPGQVIVGALNIVLYVIVCIFAIIIVFELIGCLLGLPRIRP